MSFCGECVKFVRAVGGVCSICGVIVAGPAVAVHSTAGAASTYVASSSPIARYYSPSGRARSGDDNGDQDRPEAEVTAYTDWDGGGTAVVGFRIADDRPWDGWQLLSGILPPDAPAPKAPIDIRFNPRFPDWLMASDLVRLRRACGFC